MRQVWIPRAGGPEVLTLREAEDAPIGAGEVRVEVEAAGVNFADLMGRMGVYPDAPPFPFVPGYEICGRIVEVGDKVNTSRIGERVLGMCRFGGYSSVVVVPAAQVVACPEGLDAVTGASIPVAGLTAWMLCEVFGRVREGDRVLVHSAGGGVGLMALDLIKWRGATAIGTASAGKHERLLARGYDQVIDYRTSDFAQVLADDEGLDLILDPIGGASWSKGLSLLRPGGRLGCFGLSAQATSSRRSVIASISAVMSVPWLQINPISLMNRNLGVFGVNMGRLWDETDRVTIWLQSLLALYEQGHIRPMIHKTFPLEQASAAHACIHNRENFGKVILTM